eukprot:UN12948
MAIINKVDNKLTQSTNRIHLNSKPVKNVIYLFIFVIICPISYASSSAARADPSDPVAKEYDVQLYDCKRHLFVLYMLLTISLCLLILTYRIARTYKLSLIACEAKLQALIIHSHNASPSRFRGTGTPIQLTRQHQSDSVIHRKIRKTSDINSGSMPDINGSILEHPHNVERRASFWKTIGDYLIHVKENGEIESHNFTSV